MIRRRTHRGQSPVCLDHEALNSTGAPPPAGEILLAIDQELGESATLRIAPELSDPVGSLEVGGHEDVELRVAEG
jgi:hypothetical protein